MSLDTMTSITEGPAIVGIQRDRSDLVDMTTFAPFFLIDGSCRALVLLDASFEEKAHIFEERSAEGWTGNGLDWNSVAQVIIVEQLPKLADELTFDSDASLFSASGDIASLTLLGNALKITFDDEHVLRDILFRAKLHD
ncbi:immunity protein 51 of polymorphic toxin system [Collimonas sp. PA-H2]|uniref:Imm51 family immunity protein n=1 Tax=Collimonas sp. PA-H2 TaxID=1881062 RepID=UPI000BF3BF22|nr:Imm51 family immunity protein [Collimonas sp. PA-H2]PFH07804.1 immunity protein 51 of polymorphic toxin system [Collimonas sp. PA-H2]